MPAIGLTADHLLVTRIEAAHLLSRDGMNSIFRKSDIPVELHHRESPLITQLPNGCVVQYTSVMPVGTEHDHRRLTHATVVIFRSLVKFKVIALREVALDHVIERGSVIVAVERYRVVGVFVFQL